MYTSLAPKLEKEVVSCHRRAADILCQLRSRANPLLYETLFELGAHGRFETTGAKERYYRVLERKWVNTNDELTCAARKLVLKSVDIPRTHYKNTAVLHHTHV